MLVLETIDFLVLTLQEKRHLRWELTNVFGKWNNISGYIGRVCRSLFFPEIQSRAGNNGIQDEIPHRGKIQHSGCDSCRRSIFNVRWLMMCPLALEVTFSFYCG